MTSGPMHGLGHGSAGEHAFANTATNDIGTK